MVRHICALAFILTLSCVDQSTGALTISKCGAATDCDTEPCTIATCDDGVCEYKSTINGSSCGIDDERGACLDGICVAVSSNLIEHCLDASGECEKDSDCFIRQCTSSMCVNNQCVHVPYENGVKCIDYSVELGFYTGTCGECACVPK